MADPLLKPSSLISFTADGIYELDQQITFSSSRPTRYTLSYYAQSPSGSTCAILPSIGTDGGHYEGLPLALSSSWTKYSISYTTNGGTRGFVALVVQCFSGTNNLVYLDQISLS